MTKWTPYSTKASSHKHVVGPMCSCGAIRHGVAPGWYYRRWMGARARVGIQVRCPECTEKELRC